MSLASLAGIGSVLGPIGQFGSDIITNVLNQRNMKKQWEREDTSVQRRVQDLVKAGLNPVLAAGQGATSSPPIRIEPPTVDGGGFGRAIQARVLANQQRMTAADAARAESEAAKARAEASVAATTANVYAMHSDLLPKEYQGLSVGEAKILNDVLQSGLSTQLTGTNLNTAQINLELLKKFGVAQGWVELVSDGLRGILNAANIGAQGKYILRK